jgi:hypothetical protein
MIPSLYNWCFEKSSGSFIKDIPQSLFQHVALKKEIQIVFKDNKAWIFDYENSVLYTLTQIAALFVYALIQGHKYKEIVNAISEYYNVPVFRVDSNCQEFLSEMYKLKLILNCNSKCNT